MCGGYGGTLAVPLDRWKCGPQSALNTALGRATKRLDKRQSELTRREWLNARIAGNDRETAQPIKDLSNPPVIDL